MNKRKGSGVILVLIVVIIVIIGGGIWYFYANKGAGSKQAVQGYSQTETSTQPAANPPQEPPNLLPVEIAQPATGTQWGIGQTVQIKWMATVPWNASGNNPNVSQGSFLIQLISSNGSVLTIASGSAAIFKVSEGDVYSQFQTNFAIPKSEAAGTYSVVIDQYLGETRSVGQQSVLIISNPAPTTPTGQGRG